MKCGYVIEPATGRLLRRVIAPEEALDLQAGPGEVVVETFEVFEDEDQWVWNGQQFIPAP